MNLTINNRKYTVRNHRFLVTYHKQVLGPWNIFLKIFTPWNSLKTLIEKYTLEILPLLTKKSEVLDRCDSAHLKS